MQEHLSSHSHEAAEPEPVRFTNEEWQALHMSADPLNDPEVAAIMADKQISFDGNPLDVVVDGGEEGEAARRFMMTTDREDPFTRHRELTEAHQAALSEVVETYGEDGSLEVVLDDAREAFGEQLTATTHEFNASLPNVVRKQAESHELLGQLQGKIESELSEAVDLLSRTASVSPRDIEAIINQIQSVDKNLRGQIDTVTTERRLSGGLQRHAAEVSMRVRAKTEEYRAVLNHLTEGGSEADREERQIEAGRAEVAVLANVVELEADATSLNDQLRVVEGMAGDHHRALRVTQGRLTELHDTLRRTGQLDQDVFRYVKLKVQEIQQSQTSVRKRINGLTVLAGRQA